MEWLLVSIYSLYCFLVWAICKVASDADDEAEKMMMIGE